MQKPQGWLIFGVLLLILCLVFGVYFLPSNHSLVKTNDPDATALQLSIMANQVSSMNYLLTFIGLAGIGFTIFGYYQSTKIPEMIDKRIQNWLDIFEKEEDINNNRLDEKISTVASRLDELTDNQLDKIYEAIYRDRIYTSLNFDDFNSLLKTANDLDDYKEIGNYLLRTSETLIEQHPSFYSKRIILSQISKIIDKIQDDRSEKNISQKKLGFSEGKEEWAIYVYLNNLYKEVAFHKRVRDYNYKSVIDRDIDQNN